MSPFEVKLMRVFIIKGQKSMPDDKKPLKIYYNDHLKEISRELRKKGVLSEVLLWQKLRAGQMMGYKFNRQRPVGSYMVDFSVRD